mgnify:FL=1
MADFSSNKNTYTSNLPILLAKTVDTVINYSPITAWLLSNQKEWGNGTQIQKAIKWRQNTQGMSFDALEEFNTQKTENFEKMLFNPTGREIPVVISGMESTFAQGGVIDLVARQLESDSQDLADDIAELFFTVQTGKNFSSLLDFCGDSTIAANYGGLSKTTYTGLAGNYTASIGNITLARLRTQLNACTHGGKSPDLILTTKAVFGYLEALMNATIQSTLLQSNLKGYDHFLSNGAIAASGSKLVGQAGFNALLFANVPIVADEKCNSGELYTIRKDTVGFYGKTPSAELGYSPISMKSSEIDGVMVDAPSTLGFGFSGFKMPINQFGVVGHIVLLGNLVCDNPRLSGYLAGITG